MSAAMMQNMSVPVLSLQDIHMAFGGIVAIEKFDLDIAAGEVVALVGDNGAGKSTLIKIIAGVQAPTSGRIRIDGAEVAMRDPSDSQALGIQVVYQDLALADSQPVYMNMFLGKELVTGPFRRLDRKSMIAQTEALVKELDVRIPSARATIREMSGGQRQGVAIARATHWATKLVLMDEPTAALGVAETAKVEKIIEGLKARAMPILIISHSLDQVFRLSDRICVLRRGKQIGIRETGNTDKNEIVSMITGLST
jgi:ABC-type sugar transport system ATPase subunit